MSGEDYLCLAVYSFLTDKTNASIPWELAVDTQTVQTLKVVAHRFPQPVIPTTTQRQTRRNAMTKFDVTHLTKMVDCSYLLFDPPPPRS